jgi:hypothetical protein
MQSSFENMSKVELRAYLIANPGDQEAFHMFVAICLHTYRSVQRWI